jgi:hypothetical protein
MGYTTEFKGEFNLDKPLDDETKNLLKQISDTRHEYEDNTYPGIWCQWVYDQKWNTIKWDGGEKFYEYVKWIKYLIKEVFAPKGYVINGDVEWQGDEDDDKGLICIKNNKVKTKHIETIYVTDDD